MKEFIRIRLNEELTKSDVKAEITTALDSTALKDIVSKIVIDKLKTNRELEDKMVDITKNVITQLYKTLWTKRGFWQGTLSNKAS